MEKTIKSQKMLTVISAIFQRKFRQNEVAARRIRNYDYKENTVITGDDKHIKIRTETNIKCVHNILWLFRDGTSKLNFEFIKD